MRVNSRLPLLNCRSTMKTAKRRSTYPALSMAPEIQEVLDADIERQGYSNYPPAMEAWAAWLSRSIAFEHKQAIGR